MTANLPIPLTILIIRHAEKKGQAWPGPGLTVEGVEDEKSLVIRGWQRAGAWAALFGTDLGGNKYPTPSVIYAANPDTSSLEEPTPRPFQTVTPLSNRLVFKGSVTYGRILRVPTNKSYFKGTWVSFSPQGRPLNEAFSRD
jgi:hypothetical protein